MKTKAAGMFALLIMALSIVGFAYAHWSDRLDINGTLHTGEVDVYYSAVSCIETDPCGVGGCTVVITTDQDGDSDDKLEICLTDVYPGYVCRVEFTITNRGDIPVHFEGKTWTVPLPPWVIESESFPSPIDAGLSGTGYIEFSIDQERAPQDTTISFELKITYNQCNL